MMCQGMSQRAIARTLRISRGSVSRRVVQYGNFCENQLDGYRKSRENCKEIQFDELETFEHSKCKPVTVPIAVEADTRKILSLDVGAIAAKGKLANISVKKYGKRKCYRKNVLRNLLRDLKNCADENTTFRTDKSKHYPPRMKEFFPTNTHLKHKGRRACVVGQGELKSGGFDPLFSLNHTYAMFRDNLKRLSRKTWCTSKLIKYLKRMLYMYAWYHNCSLEGEIVRLKKSVFSGPVNEASL